MKLIVGLGNPGKKYEKTRHNIGFEVLKELKDEFGISNFKKKFQGEIGETIYNREKVLILAPTTYMNLSGNSVIEAVNFFKLDTKKDLIIIYDDMDLQLGQIRIREKGSAGGHNGIKSIISHLGIEFLRIKCGIGRPREEGTIISHVLSKFSKEEEELYTEMIKTAVDIVKEYIEGKEMSNIMNKYNRNTAG